MNTRQSSSNVSILTIISKLSRHRSGVRLGLGLIGLALFLGLARTPATESASAAFKGNITYAQQVKLLAPDGAAKDYFSSSVAISGDWAVIGAGGRDVGPNQDQGAAYVYKRSGGTWAFHQKLITIDGQAGSRFHSVAIEGTTIVIGAPGHNSERGAAYVFVLSGVDWFEQQKLVAGDGMSDDRFGTAVAISEQTIVVGASRLLQGFQPGAAYVFFRTGNTWAQQQKLMASDGQPFNNFGFEVAISGGTVAVVAHIFKGPVPSGPGAIYIYVRTGVTWTEQQKLTTTQYGGFDLGGLKGDTLVAGNYTKAQIFFRNGGVWTQQQELELPDTEFFLYGYTSGSIAFDGDRIVIGTPHNTMFDGKNRGSAYIFNREGTTWDFEQKVIATDGGAEDEFGTSVAISGDTVLVGALDEIGANTDQGSAYIFEFNSNNLLPKIIPVGPIAIQKGKTLTDVLIATVKDEEDSAGSLLVQAQHNWSNLISNVINSGGQITATINAACNGGTGEKKIGFNVLDNQLAIGVTYLIVNVVDNPPPSIGTYPAASVLPGGTVTVSPTAPPADNGPVTLSVFSFGGGSSGFDGLLSVNKLTGEVTINNAGPGGTYTISVTVTDDCSVIARNFKLTVAKYEIAPVLVSSANPSVYSRPVTFSVMINAPRGAPTPTGLVQFQVDGISRGLPVRLSRGAAQATTSSLSPGTHQITAVYRGDENYNRSLTTITQVVNR